MHNTETRQKFMDRIFGSEAAVSPLKVASSNYVKFSLFSRFNAQLSGHTYADKHLLFVEHCAKLSCR